MRSPHCSHGANCLRNEHFWTDHIGTGDNERERIYTTLYSRLTTKSNTYTVHFRAQSLVQTAQSKTDGTWTEGKDTVTSESRGATTVERYMDPGDATIPDYANGTNPFSKDLMGNHYRWRIVETQRFAPQEARLIAGPSEGLETSREAQNQVSFTQSRRFRSLMADTRMISKYVEGNGEDHFLRGTNRSSLVQAGGSRRTRLNRCVYEQPIR